MKSFVQHLSENDLVLTRDDAITLQVNVGLMCNLACKHCHLSAGPGREENMTRETAEEVVAFARRFSFSVIDITGGAPELNPNLGYLIESLAPLTKKLMLRSNLVSLSDENREELLDLCVRHQVGIVASFPSLNQTQLEAQRGDGVFDISVLVLKRLNELGYGKKGSGLELNLVSNPAGAFIPDKQEALQKRFEKGLWRNWGIVFDNVFTFANVPLGRFRDWLEAKGNLGEYMERLSSLFNPCALQGVMCRSLISISWDGFLYDCDFNQVVSLPMAGEKIHLSELYTLPEPGTPVAVGDHCYACTAGVGFT